jgi:hypothetical protein
MESEHRPATGEALIKKFPKPLHGCREGLLYHPVNISTRIDQSHEHSTVIPGFRTYDQKYPKDEPGQEMGENARIWKIYREEAIEFDTDKIDEWHKTLDWLLVFVRLNLLTANSLFS